MGKAPRTVPAHPKCLAKLSCKGNWVRCGETCGECGLTCRGCGPLRRLPDLPALCHLRGNTVLEGILEPTPAAFTPVHLLPVGAAAEATVTGSPPGTRGFGILHPGPFGPHVPRGASCLHGCLTQAALLTSLPSQSISQPQPAALAAHFPSDAPGPSPLLHLAEEESVTHSRCCHHSVRCLCQPLAASGVRPVAERGTKAKMFGP